LGAEALSAKKDSKETKRNNTRVFGCLKRKKLKRGNKLEWGEKKRPLGSTLRQKALDGRQKTYEFHRRKNHNYWSEPVKRGKKSAKRERKVGGFGQVWETTRFTENKN